MICITDCAFCTHNREFLKDGWIPTCDAFPEGLSEYAWNNSNPQPIGEFIAEAWSEYCNNPTPRTIAKTVGDRILEIYKTWKK